MSFGPNSEGQCGRSRLRIKLSGQTSPVVGGSLGKPPILHRLPQLCVIATGLHRDESGNPRAARQIGRAPMGQFCRPQNEIARFTFDLSRLPAIQPWIEEIKVVSPRVPLEPSVQVLVNIR